ncbi:hypothetical protein PWM43_08320 [Acetobacteraceae bacterium LMG 32668]|nr:hypothetical protein [Brytella acorum]
MQSSHMALSHPSLNTYATRMISDHQKTSHELKQLLSSNNMEGSKNPLVLRLSL